MRRRARFLRKARELAYRDLGGLVFNLHRFGQRNDPLVVAKLNTLSHIDAELRALDTSLKEHQPVTVLREAGITACPRCAAIHSGEDHFCPNCGLSMSRQADVPIGAAPPAPASGGGFPNPASPPSASAQAPKATPAQSPAPAAAVQAPVSAGRAGTGQPAAPYAAPRPT